MAHLDIEFLSELNDLINAQALDLIVFFIEVLTERGIVNIRMVNRGQRINDLEIKGLKIYNSIKNHVSDIMKKTISIR